MMLKKHFFFAALIILSSCTTHTNWQLSAIPTAQKEFDSARLCYLPSDCLGSMSLEFVCSNGSVTGYVSSSARRFEQDDAMAQIRLGSETLEFPLKIHEGRMRATLPDELTIKAYLALQDGQPITIIVGSLQQNFEPEQFAALFSQLTKGKNTFLDSFQGPLP
jgi:hypothetical protein